jgi:hypothetical protein
MIICDICKQEIRAEKRFTLTAVVGKDPTRSTEVVHACSIEHFVIGLARCSRENAEAFKVGEDVLQQARAELAPPAPVLPSGGPYR